MSLRTLFRVPLIVLVTLFAHGLNLLSRYSLRFITPRGHLAVRHFALRTWGTWISKIFGIRIRVEGQPPQGSFFLVSNHASYIDILLLGIYAKAAFVAKADLRAWPALGWVFSTGDTIFIDRSRKRDLLRVMTKMDRKLAEGMGVVLFPEGTSGKGDEILRFKPSLLQFAAERNYPVHYATLHYATWDNDPPAHEVVCWWGDAPFLPHATKLVNLKGFDATIRFGPEPIQDGDRKQLAKRLREAMNRQFTPME